MKHLHLRLHSVKQMAGITALAALLFAVPAARALASTPSDIVPRGSTLLDAFAVLAKNNDLVGNRYTTIDFLGSRLWSRGELARIFEHAVLHNGSQDQDHGAGPVGAAMHSIAVQLAPELKLDGYTVRVSTSATPSFDLLGKIEGRSQSHSNPDGALHSGTFGIYRGTVQGDLGQSARYAVSVSNWPEDYRRVYQNDIGPHDFSALQEAYIELMNNRGLRFDIGRKYDNWGPGYRGSTMLSDNSPPFDQFSLSFPFSLGRHLGRNYFFDQMATGFEENHKMRYLEARRIGYQFSRQWEFDLGEAFKTTDSTALLYTPIPFDVGQGIRLNQAQYQFNYQLNSQLTYSPSPWSRLYGQYFVDDIKSPFNSGKFLGFSVGRHEFVERKIAYLVGIHLQGNEGTAGTLEYDLADPFTYTYRNTSGIWQHGTYDWIGLPAGPNAREVYVRLDQRFGKKFLAAVDYRDRWRAHNSFAMPTAEEIGAEGDYQITNQDSVGLNYYDYKQDPFPLPANTPGLSPYAPVTEGDFGKHLRANEVDFSYSHVF